MDKSIPLSQLKVGQRGQIAKVHGHNPLRQRFLDMGLVKDTPVEVVNFAPLGDPMRINVRGYQLAIRKHEAELIEVVPIPAPPQPAKDSTPRQFGFTLPALQLRQPPARAAADLRPAEAAEHTILLAGNPNCGKSTLFNALTGSHQHVGNWPGKTVEKKEGLWESGDTRCRVVDLPGTYSLTAYSMEEIIARTAILEHAADLVVIVADAANLERNLYLVVQILEMGVNALLVLNMWDMLEDAGLKVDPQRLSAQLGIPVLTTTLSKGQGLGQLKQAMLAALKNSAPRTHASTPFQPSASHHC